MSYIPLTLSPTVASPPVPATGTAIAALLTSLIPVSDLGLSATVNGCLKVPA